MNLFLKHHRADLIYSLWALVFMPVAAWASPSPAIGLEQKQPVGFESADVAPPDLDATPWEGIWGNDESQASDFPFEMHILFSPGYQRLNLSNINPLMTQRGYAAFEENMVAFGGSFQMIWWNVLTEWEGGASLTAPVSNQDFVAQLYSGYFFMNLGYRFKPLKNLSIYPLLGLGINTLDLNFTRRALLPSLDDFLDNPGWQGSISNTLFAINLGLGLDWHWDWVGTLGLRGGYILNPFAGNWWTLNDLQSNEDRQGPPLSNGPATSLSGPYVRLNLGF